MVVWHELIMINNKGYDEILNSIFILISNDG